MPEFTPRSGACLLTLGLLLTLSCSASSQGDDVATATSRSQTAETVASTIVLQDWRQFRGPTAMGTSEDTSLPVEWNEESNISWKVELPGGGSSTPIIYQDRIYLTTYSGYLVPGQPRGSLDDLERHLVCLKKSDGEVLWQKSVKAKPPEEEQIRDHGYAANSVTVDDDHIYAFFGKSGVFAFDHDGDQVWQADVGDGTHGWGSGASPVLYKELVIINASVESRSLFALNRRTGEQVWQADGINEAWNTPIIVNSLSGKDELVVATHGKIIALEPESGKRIWNCDTDITWYMVPSLVASDGIVYALGGRSGTAALAVKTGGTGDVTGSHRIWTSLKGSNVTSPVYQDGYLYWMHEKLGIAYCADAETGELAYENRVQRAGQVYASSLLADGRVYYTNRSGTTFVVAAKPEFELLSTNPLSDGTLFNASPAVSDGCLYLRSEKHLYCVKGQ